MPETTAFGNGPAQQNELCALVVAGQKRGTASLALWYDVEQTRKRAAGELVIACDGTGAPRAVLEITSVHETAFSEVDPAFAADEGEGDGSLDYWRAEHERFFTRELADAALVFSDDLAVVCERFRVLWDGASGEKSLNGRERP